jgi:hypothetical protein
VVKELYYAMKGNSPQIRHEGDDANVNFLWEGFRVSKGGRRTRLIQNYTRQILRCLKLKYLSFFSARSDFRHAGMDVN